MSIFDRGLLSHRLKLSNIDAPQPPPKHLQVTILAAALNHRDLFIRQSLYPAISFTTPLLADGCGIVTGLPSSTPSSKYLNKRVILAPSQGWESSPDGPEGGKGITILGGTKTIELGTAQEVLVVREEEVEIAPEHLSDEQAAALPLTGLTAWRAFVTKSGNAEEGRNILVTGIGGGVALNVLQFAVGKGCNVYVTSGSEEKIEKAKALGAAGGVNYKNNDWDKELVALLPKDRKYIDAIIDGAGGDIVKRGVKFLKQGGVIVSYGMTLAPKVDYLMSAVLRNIDIRGSTMGSRKEFRDMVEFVNEKKIVPVVSKVVNGLDDLEGVEGLFQEMKEGKQFGKLVIKVKKDSTSKL
jgi:NADPH:quinone reductase-like Zn-dependent oxidoreductase